MTSSSVDLSSERTLTAQAQLHHRVKAEGITAHIHSGLQDFDLENLMNMVLSEYGEDAVQWVKDAAHVAKWWVKVHGGRFLHSRTATLGQG
jgi:hypothetical protein